MDKFDVEYRQRVITMVIKPIVMDEKDVQKVFIRVNAKKN